MRIVGGVVTPIGNKQNSIKAVISLETFYRAKNKFREEEEEESQPHEAIGFVNADMSN